MTELEQVTEYITKHRLINPTCNCSSYNDWCKRYAELTIPLHSQAERAVEVLRALVEKLNAVHEDPQYKGVWTLHHVHGGRYSGLTYEKELGDGMKFLAEQPGGGNENQS